MLSVCPDSAAFRPLFSLMNATRRSKMAPASGLMLLLSKSKSTSSSMMVRSTLGAGFGFGFGAGGGGGGGGGAGFGFGSSVIRYASPPQSNAPPIAPAAM